jgi:formylmethanofuran dehydrogenase subunit B
MTPFDSAVDLGPAAAAIAAARRVLVTGMVGAEPTAVVAACDVAEACGGAFDPGSPETSRLVGPLVARIGAVTASAADLRDRADLVVFWFCDAAAAVPESAARDRGDAPRRTIAIGPRSVLAVGSRHRHLPLPAAAAIDCGRLVEAIVRGVPLDESAGESATAAAARDLAAAIAAARTVAFVSDWSADVDGLAAWSTISLVRALAHVKPAFEVPLGERTDAAIAACTWRYAAAGAIDRADRRESRFLPAEADAVRLIDRGEVDCVVLIGEATPPVTAAIDRAGDGIAIVRLPADGAVIEPLVALLRADAEAAS